MRPEPCTCRECFDEYEPVGIDDGFCSDTCERAYDAGLSGATEDEDEE